VISDRTLPPAAATGLPRGQGLGAVRLPDTGNKENGGGKLLHA